MKRINWTIQRAIALAAVFCCSQAMGQAILEGSPDPNYGPLHAWYDVNQSVGILEIRDDIHIDEYLVDVRDSETQTDIDRGSTYPTNVETWAQFDSDGSAPDVWTERVGGFTGDLNGKTVWEVRNGTGFDDGGGWNDLDGIGTGGIGLDGGYSIVMLLNIHSVQSHNSVWNGDPGDPRDDVPILNGKTSFFNEDATDGSELEKGLIWIDANRAGQTGPQWVIDSGAELVTGPATLDTWQVHTFTINDDGTTSHYVDNELLGSGDAGVFEMSYVDFWGTDGGWHRAANLDFAEGLFYDEVLTESDRQGVYDYLSSKWLQDSTQPGDYNNDGFVAQSDLDLVLLNWGETTVPAEWVNEVPGDFVGQTQLDGVLLNWGGGTPPTLANVPEPSSLLLLVSAVCLLRRRCF